MLDLPAVNQNIDSEQEAASGLLAGLPPRLGIMNLDPDELATMGRTLESLKSEPYVTIKIPLNPETAIPYRNPDNSISVAALRIDVNGVPWVILPDTPTKVPKTVYEQIKMQAINKELVPSRLPGNENLCF
jgi:hypothetical protein